MTLATEESWEELRSFEPILKAIAALSESEALHPKHYYICLSFDREDLMLTARVQLWAEAVRESARFPVLLCDQLEVTELLVNDGPREMERSEAVVWVRPGVPLVAGQQVSLSASYRGRLPRAYVAREEERTWVELHPTGFWCPLVAWRFDLSLLVPFRLECRFPRGLVAVANADRVGLREQPQHMDYTWESIAGEPLIAVLAGPYVVRSAERQGLEITCYGRPQVEAHLGEMMEEAAGLIAYYTDLFGPTTMRSMQIVVPPHSSGGNWAMGNLIVGAQMPAHDCNRRLSILSHEIAHHWWGQSVHFDFSADPWLAEGLTEFSAMRARLHLAGEARSLESLREWTLPRYEEARGTGFSLADCRIDSPHSEEIRENGGAVFLSQLRARLGGEESDARLHCFYQQFRGRRAATTDFEAAMTTGQPEGVAGLFEAWVHEADWPEITAEQVLAGLR